MSFFNEMFGNASEVDIPKMQREFADVLADGETIEKAFRLVRDLYVFTNKRLVLVDRQGMTGSKVAYHSIPYKSITHFSVETAGSFDRDAELRIWVSGTDAPIKKEFKRGSDIVGMQRMLAQHVLR